MHGYLVAYCLLSHPLDGLDDYDMCIPYMYSVSVAFNYFHVMAQSSQHRAASLPHSACSDN